MVNCECEPVKAVPDECSCEPSEILIFPCSGGSNVGQLANAAGVILTVDGRGRFFCLAGVGGHIPSMMESAKAAKRVVAIDGCSIACSKLTLEHSGFTVTDYTVITELGIKKNKNFTLDEKDVEKVCAAVIKQLSQAVK